MKNFILNGVLYRNGYACDSQGRPRTINNGYSSEDEKEAKEEYKDALNLVKEGQNATSYPEEPAFKVITREELLERDEITKLAKKHVFGYEDLKAEDWEILNNQKKYQEDGFLLNDAGEKITVENGYTDDDQRYGKYTAKRMQKDINRENTKNF